MRIKAHPTTYRGVAFRSRLEARWAAFFDQAGWRWQYEPGDYEGWSPDFALIGDHQVVMVEVKPIEWTQSLKAAHAAVSAREDLDKVRRQLDREVLVLGSYPIGLTDYGYWTPREHFLGIFWHATQDEGGGTDGAVLTTNPDQSWDIAAHTGSYHNRLSGYYDGNLENSPPPGSVHHRWGEASRLTQWKAA